MIPPATLVELCRLHAPSGIAVLDREMRYLFANRAWTRQYGLGDRDLVGQGHYEVSPEIPEAWRAAHRRCLAGGTERCERDPLQRADGTITWVRWEVVPWRTAEGAIGGIAIFSELVSEQKLLEDSHAEVQRLLADRERLLDHERAFVRRLDALRRATLAISTLDSHAGAASLPLLQLILDQGRILTGADYGALGVGTDPDQEFNPWLWSGLSEAEVAAIGRHPRPVGLLGQIARGEQMLRLDDVHGAPGAVGLPPHHPELGPLLGSPIRRRGRSIGNFYLGKRSGAPPFTLDDQSILELLADHAAIAIENAKLYEQVQADVRAREDVLAVVSHDLKSPLNSIALREQLLARQHGPTVESHTSAVTRSITEMRRMILGLLDVASLDAGSLRLELRAVEFEALVADVAQIILPLADDHRLVLDLHVDGVGTVSLDRERMWQVLSNLLGNAIKFTPAGGRIELRARRTASDLAIEVSDTGPGIPPAALPHVFERYFTTERGQHGTGLGLYIVKGLVEAHGGRVQVESAAGRGTTFFLSIPLSGAHIRR